MTPRELFNAGPVHPQWIHGSDIGVDEEGGLWVRASANLKADLDAKVAVLGTRVPPRNFREYSILTPDRKTGLDSRHRTEPLWEKVHELKSDTIGPEWVAVN